MPILLSIIIPCFKRILQTEKTLNLLLHSQGINDYFLPEIIISDSTPDDSLEKMIKKINFPFVYHHPPKGGIAINKNVGVKLAKNKLLLFLDSDMEVEETTVISLINSLKDRPRTAMLTGKTIWKKAGKIGELDRPRKEDRIYSDGQESFLEAIYSRYLLTFKEIFEKVGGYDQELFNMRGEGSDLSIRYWRAGFPLGYDSNIQVYHVHEAQEAITRNIDCPERGIVRDLIQLGFKYGLSRDGSVNFSKTLSWLKEQFGENDKFILIEDMVSLLPYFWENQEKIQASTENIPNTYDFKFLDVFSNDKLFSDCLNKAQGRLELIRKEAYLI